MNNIDNSESKNIINKHYMSGTSWDFLNPLNLYKLDISNFISSLSNHGLKK